MAPTNNSGESFSRKMVDEKLFPISSVNYAKTKKKKYDGSIALMIGGVLA